MKPMPYDPLRRTLYSSSELMAGYDRRHPETALDAIIATHYKESGGLSPDTGEALTQRLHDFAIDRALLAFLKGSESGHEMKMVGIMGDHSTSRIDSEYVRVFELGIMLTQSGFTIVTGGGLGVMEAGNCAGYLGCYGNEIAYACLAELQETPTYSGSEAAFINQSLDIRASYPKGALNLAIPTWVYDREPISQFSTHIAKYFSNSIREDGLLGVAKYGIIFAAGGAGTMQEIFQDAAHNAYQSYNYTAPMVFLGSSYTQHSAAYDGVMQLAKRYKFDEFVSAVDNPCDALSFLKSHPPNVNRTVSAFISSPWASYHLS